MKLTTKQNEDFAVRKGKDKEGPFVELLTGWDAEQFILTPKEAIRLGNALIKAAQPKKQKEVGVIRVIMPHPDTCNGKGVDLVELTEEALTTPSAAGPKMHRYKVESIHPSRWSE